MSVIGSAIDFVLLFAIIVVIGRFIIEWVTMLAPNYRPSGAMAALFEVIYTLTDRPIRALRAVIPAVRIGQASLDFSPIVLILALNLLRVLNSMIFF